MVRGRWLARAALAGALEALARVYARPAAMHRPSPAQAQILAQRARQAVNSGFVYNARILAEAEAALRHAGAAASANRLAALAVAPATGPCHAIRW